MCANAKATPINDHSYSCHMHNQCTVASCHMNLFNQWDVVHITSLVINSLEGRNTHTCVHTQTHTKAHKHIQTSKQKHLEETRCGGLWLAHAWFKKHFTQLFNIYNSNSSSFKNLHPPPCVLEMKFEFYECHFCDNDLQ